MKECPLCGACQDDEVLRCHEDNQPLEPSLSGPRTIGGKYILDRRLGKGGMGAVYKATHKDLRRSFALKIIRLHRLRSAGALARFEVEARALGRLQHPHIVQVTDYGVDPRGAGLPFLVMEYLEGETLLQYLERNKALSPEEALPIAEATAAAVDHAHAARILHRDLKPQNIFLAGEPRNRQVKIVDFGLARIADEHAAAEAPAAVAAAVRTEEPPPDDAAFPTQTITRAERTMSLGPAAAGGASLTAAGTLMGTPGYIAPEMAAGGSAGPAVDIFAFGVVFYEMLTGRKPFDPAVIKPGEARSAPKPTLPSAARPSVPPELDDVLLGPLEADPARRPPTAGEVVRQFKQALAAFRYRTWRAKEEPRRFKIAGALSLAMVPLFFILAATQAVRNVENRLADFRFELLPRHPPDDRVVILSIDDATLQAEPALLADRADDMGTRLQAVMDGGALGVAVDFLLPERWNQSPSFATFLLRNQGTVTLASYVTKDGGVLGMELLTGLIMAALGDRDRAESLFGFVNIQPDGDGRIRRMSLGVKKRDGGWMYSLPARAFKTVAGREVPPKMLSKPRWIDLAIDRAGFPRLSWKDLPAALAADPGYFRGRFVLVGGEYAGSQDFHTLPAGSTAGDDEVSGLVVQALTLSTLLDGRPVRETPGWVIAIVTALAAMAFSSVLLLSPKARLLVLAWVGVWAGYLVLCGLLFTARRILLPAFLPIILWAGAMAAVLLWRRRLTFVSKEGEI